MAIIKLDDKYKSKFQISLTPERHYISSSSGITGSVYVFPNRSITQKDNIDERLNLAPMAEAGSEFSGTPIRPYDANSLEARRIEIYQGDFGKMIGGVFTDALQYEYVFDNSDNGENPLADGTYTADAINSASTVETNDTATRTADGMIFTYTSNNNWSVSDGSAVYNTLPTDDRDRSAMNYEVALGLLLDGAHPFAEDHALRSTYTYAGSSSGTSGATASQFQFTGRNIAYDEADLPYLDTLVSSASEVNAWPPEVAKHGSSIITNYMMLGYSDLSMHPRNATKKEIVLQKADHDLFSSGSLQQKILARKLSDSTTPNRGWWYHNYQALSLSKYVQNGTTYLPALLYDNSTSVYDLAKTDAFMFEFWIKPTAEQTVAGTIVHVPGNYAITIHPSETVNGVPQKFKLYFHWATKASMTTNPATTYDFRSTAVLNLDIWSHVLIRYSQDFNNGQFVVFIDDDAQTPLDGGSISRSNAGIFHSNANQVASTSTERELMCVGGWWDETTANRQLQIFNLYAATQGLTPNSQGGSSIADGLNFSINYQLKCELHELRCWNTVKTQSDILLSKIQSPTTTDEMRFYMPFFFDPRDDVPVWKRPGFTPDIGAESRTRYYQDGSITTISSTNLGPTTPEVAPFCVNNAYIAGMPSVNVHAHLREYKNGKYPVILGYPERALPGTPSATVRPTSLPAVADTLIFESPQLTTTLEEIAVVITFTNSGGTDATFTTGAANIDIANDDTTTAAVVDAIATLINSLSDYTASDDGTTATITAAVNNLDYNLIITASSISDFTITTSVSNVYPALTNSVDTVSNKRIQYFIDHWQQIPWLKALNSMLIPCDNSSFRPQYDLVSSVGHFYLSNSNFIRLDGSGIGSTSSEYQLRHFFDDEQYSIQETVQNIDPSEASSKIQQTLNVDTDFLVNRNLLTDIDYITPLSTIISIPSIYFGNNVHPGSVELKFQINADGKEVRIVDRDGLLYRFDTKTDYAINKVGQIDYVTGILVIYSPLLTNLGIDNFDLKFKGHKNLHVMQLDIPCATGVGNISSNPSYQALAPTANQNESKSNFTYISALYLHDENLNVVGKVNLAQPIVKREEDSFIFRVKVDF